MKKIRLLSAALCLLMLISALCSCNLNILENESSGEAGAESRPDASAENGSSGAEEASEPTEVSYEEGVDPSEIRSNYKLMITEIMCASSMYFDENGNTSDWVELFNYGESAVDLGELCLSASQGYNNDGKLTGTVPANGYKVIYCGSENLPFNPNAGDTVFLSHKSGVVIHSVGVSDELGKDFSYAFGGVSSGGNAGQSNGDGYIATSLCTPGYPNTLEGLEAYLASAKTAGPLVIYELMPSNASYYEQDGKTYDWLEIKNISSSAVRLSDYTLSDKSAVPELFRLPDKTLAAGETFTVICSGDESLTTSKYCHAPFKISSDSDRLYITSTDGKLSDAVLVKDVPYSGSFGRIDGKNGFFYFATPTPGAKNTAGTRAVAYTPVVSVTPGVYKDTQTVSIIGDGTVHYTTDGSVPDSSDPVYTGAIEISKSTVIRCLSVCSGKTDSAVLTASYIIGEFSLPVVSIAIEPDDMWSAERGIYYGEEGDSNANYWKKWEREINLTIFGKETGDISVNCGIKLSGDGSRELPKKSFQLKFRSIYGAGELDYDVFGDGSVTSFDSIKLRAGEDYPYAIFRDELITSLAGDSTKVMVQDYRFVVLYINGGSFGIYAFRDKLDEDYVAYKENVPVSDVTLMGYNGDPEYGSASEYNALKKYITSKDMTDSANYAYVESQIDIDSLIDWVISQVYTGNRDLGNDRAYKVRDGKWKWVLYDTDWGMYFQDKAYYLLTSGYCKGTAEIVKGLLKNQTFRDRYLKRLAEQLKTVYTYENVCKKCDTLQALLQDDAAENFARWGGSVTSWEKNIAKLKTFASERYDNVVKQTVDYFDLTASQKTSYFG